MSIPYLGFCGLGLMGTPVARRLLQAGHRVQVWNRTPEKVRPLLDEGAILAASPRAMAMQCAIVFTCLTDQSAVEKIVFGDEGLHGGDALRLVVDHSSISPVATREFAQRLSEACEASWIDAPVSGGAAGATAGTLTVMAGGNTEDIESVRPFMRAYASNVVQIGSVGAGQVAKLCNQTIVVATLSAIAEAISLAWDNEIDATILRSALAGGWADSVLLQTFVPRMTGAVSSDIGAISTMLKDIDNIGYAAQATGTPMPVLSAVQQRFRVAVARGLGSEDLSKIIHAFSDALATR
ncbi:NAD(P)-dependent oxidoreductase [Paraburkholderia sp. GAS32]|uniref:NAD(P)-dependent oxidoreductase n=1 Tax=Paraburkholderia sp. GAS32 TaxID=3035129 RepID=UPI003D25F65E